MAARRWVTCVALAALGAAGLAVSRGGVHAQAERAAPLGQGHRPYTARRGMAPGAVRVRVHGLDALALPLADAAAAGHELAASLGGHSAHPDIRGPGL